MTPTRPPDAERLRLEESRRRITNWKRWGPYLAERQWGTVREDYSTWGDCWEYFPHEHARSRAYRWGEDGLLGITDRECRLCFALALWNGNDPILKERLFGLTGPQGNHGEDVKECYYYLDSTPTHSYLKALYKYPQTEFPYAQLLEENKQRTRLDREYELLDTGVFAGKRYFDIQAEYAKAGPDDILIRLTIANRGPDAAPIHVLPTLWYRNTWIWGCKHEGCWVKPNMYATGPASVRGEHIDFGKHYLVAGAASSGMKPELLFTENESNTRLLFGTSNWTEYVKDAFHARVVHRNFDATNPKQLGTKVAAWYDLEVPAGGVETIQLRLSNQELTAADCQGPAFDRIFTDRIREADEFYAGCLPPTLGAAERDIARQAYAGLLWSKQFYHYIVEDWLDGDPEQPSPPVERRAGRNKDWRQLYNRDVISMPDKWEYPWYAAWDLAFHMIPFADLDPDFAKEQLTLFLREWYMRPDGQLPAYEFELSDVNPPVHAWAAWRVYKMTGVRGERDVRFLASAFQKLLLNFTWWINRKDADGRNLFQGGFLGLDNIGMFDRSRPLPNGGHLQQADATAWMAFYCGTMLSMALELASHDSVYEDMASKFFEHFVRIADAINSHGGTGLWDEADGFYYDQIQSSSEVLPVRARSIVGLLPLIAVEVIEDVDVAKLQGFRKRMQWFLDNRPDLAPQISYLEKDDGQGLRLLAIPSRERLERMLRYLLDENEFLAPYGIRALSRAHMDNPCTLSLDGLDYRVDYEPAESRSGLFGGNSNWRGPVWFPTNFLLIEALERYHHFYRDHLRTECPVGSGILMNLQEVANELRRRLASLFVPDADGRRPCHGNDSIYATDPHWKSLVLFYEYFQAETGRGLGANHQTGWTALAARCIADLAPARRKQAEHA